MTIPEADTHEQSKAAIVVEGLTKRFGDVTAVDSATFSVNEGEFFGFLGPNGAGKTTTINMLTGLARTDAAGAGFRPAGSILRCPVRRQPAEHPAEVDRLGRRPAQKNCGKKRR